MSVCVCVNLKDVFNDGDFFVVSHLSNHSQLSPEARFFLLFITVTTNRQKYTQLVLPIDPITIQITPFLHISQLKPISYVNTFYISLNRQGKSRLVKWFDNSYTPQQKQQYILDIHRLISSRDSKHQSNFVEFQQNKLVYRRYAGLYFYVVLI